MSPPGNQGISVNKYEVWLLHFLHQSVMAVCSLFWVVVDKALVNLQQGTGTLLESSRMNKHRAQPTAPLHPATF